MATNRAAIMTSRSAFALVLAAAVAGCGAPSVTVAADGGETDAGIVETDAGVVEADAGTEPPDAGPTILDAGPVEEPDAGTVVDAGPMGPDLDGDGLPDAWENQIARDYLPFLSIDPADSCPTGGIVFRLSPHPQDSSLIFIVYDHLYNDDCGLGGHPGDDEVFGVTVDPQVPPPAGITAIVAISHQNTLCQVITKCGSCGTLDACEFGTKDGAAYPVVYSSKDKHGSYVKKSGAGSCSTTLCLDSCTLATESAEVQLVNAGEPNAHFVENLTSQGFITSANGWTHPELLNVNPWTDADFGTAGSIAGDLVDMSFVPPPCLAP